MTIGCPVEDPEAASDAERVEPLTLLLIEDCPADSRLLQAQLGDAIRRGQVVLKVAERLSEAVTALERTAFSCVLVDLGLPDAQGVATVEALRAADADVALVVLTGNDSDDIASQTMQLGVQDYLVKGRYDSGLLLRRIRFAIQQNRRLAQLNAVRSTNFDGFSRDPASGLPNRALFEDRVARAIAIAERTGCELGVVYIGFGEPGLQSLERADADALLRRIGSHLQESMRKSDTLAAMGGDEFAAVSVPTDMTFDGVLVARRFNEVLRSLDAAPLTLVPSIGIAMYPNDGATMEALLENARQAMVRAQRAGGGVSIWARSASVVGLGPPTPYWSGTSFDTLEPLYQPWFDALEHRYAGLEVLWSRFDDAAYAAAGPAVRREAGLLAMRRALACFGAWRLAGLAIPALALNLDSALLEIPDLAFELRMLCATNRVAPNDLRLEVPAVLLGDGTPENLTQLRQLREDGYGIVVDDFLTSTDDLLALTAMPIDGIKLCHGVVSMVQADRYGGSLSRSISATLGAARSLSLDLIASGVDDSDTAATLRLLGCRYLQGAAIVEPVPAAAVSAHWLAGPPSMVAVR